MYTRVLLCFSLIFTSTLLAVASAKDAVPPSYQNALRLFQEQKYIDAIQSFQETHVAQPDNVYNLYNWGLAAYKVEKKGMAVALWRRALSLSPDFSPAQAALNFAKSTMPAEAFLPPSAGALEKFKIGMLRTLSTSNILLLHLLLFAFTGWLLIRYFGKRKRALEAEEALPPFPSVTALFIVLFVAVSALLAVDLQFRSESRATVVETNTSMKTAPQEEASTIFSLLEGSEVVIEDVQKQWTLVSYPGGMTGWVPTSNLFQISGSPKW